MRTNLFLIISLFLSVTAWSLDIGEKAPDFALLEINTQEVFTLSDWRGTWVLLDFCATDCQPCMKELPGVLTLPDKIEDMQLVLVAIDEEGSKLVKPFFKSKGFKMGVGSWLCCDPRCRIADTYGVSSIPHAVLINPDGKICGIFIGSEQGDEDTTDAIMKAYQDSISGE